MGQCAGVTEKPSGRSRLTVAMLSSPWPPWVLLALGLAPLLWLAWKWAHQDLGVNSIEYVARYTGRWALRLMLITLAVTPLRRISRLVFLVRFRRMLGLLTFLYAALHGLHYFWRDAGWNAAVIVEDLTYRRFFIAGAVSVALMIPLAATSYGAAIRWLGSRRWKLLHRLVYLSAIAGVIHYLWQGKSYNLTPLIYTGILAVLLASRLVPSRRPDPAAIRTRTAR
jgi:sulfoxide reductase heme-binding subunit YedZ